MNASALFLLLLLNLVLIGRQDRLKRREVARRLRGIIDQIQGETEGQACRVGNDACNASESKSSLLSPRQQPLLVFLWSAFQGLLASRELAGCPSLF